MSHFNSRVPVQYFASGITVDPDESITPYIKITLHPVEKVRIRFESTFGSFEPGMEVDVPFTVNETEKGVFVTESLWVETHELNVALPNVRYFVRVYDARAMTDYVKLTLFTETTVFRAKFPIQIRRKQLPVMSFHEGSAIGDLVTIVTKVCHY